MDRVAQAMAEKKGSVLRAVPCNNAGALGESEPLCVLVGSSAARDLSTDVLASMVTASEPRGFVAICLGSPWLPEARKAELAIAETLVRTAAPAPP